MRLELFSFSPTEKDATGQPKAVPQYRLVMTVPGFLHAAGKIHEAVEAISKIGKTGAAQKGRVDTEKSASEFVDSTSSSAPAKKASKPPFP